MNVKQRSPFPKIDYDTKSIMLQKIYENPLLSTYSSIELVSNKIKSVYGPLAFPPVPEDRPYLYASMVASIDGKIAFEDDTEGPLIAQLNHLDKDGGSADFWLLNMLRCVSDGSMGSGGAKVQFEESTSKHMFGVDLEGGGHIFDQDLEDDRIAGGLPALPWGIVTSLDCSEIDFSHPSMKNDPLYPVIITTSPCGLRRIKEACQVPYYVIEEPQKGESLDRKRGLPIIVTGTCAMPDAIKTMNILRSIGFKRLLVEGPSYCHHLISLGLLDELFLSYSCIYVGGKALSLGMRGNSFTSLAHPHTEMLSIHTHSPHFFYFRHRFIYDK